MYIDWKYLNICLLFLFFGVSISLAQPNPGIRYQAVYRDSVGRLLSNQNLNVDVRIREGQANGPVIYRESQSLNTDPFGLFSLTIGRGNKISDNNFSDINWIAEPHFIEVRINGQLIGRDRLEGVPYSLVATEMNIADLRDVASSFPNEGQVLAWNGNAWEAKTLDTGTDLGAGDGIQISNSTIVNTKPDQEVVLNAGTGIKIEGNYPQFTLSTEGNIGGGTPWETQNGNLYFDQGNVGIGTDEPSVRLDVNGNVSIQGSEINGNATTGALSITTGQGNNSQTMRLDGNEIDATSARMILNGNSDQDISLVNGGGRVSIGNFTSRDALGSLHIRHKGNTSPPDGLVLQNERGGFRWTFHAIHEPDDSENHRNLGFVFNNNIVAKIDPAGNFATLSDSRRKSGVVPLNSVLSRIALLSPKSYKFVETGEQLHFGFLAQEVEGLFPELVDYHKGEDRYMLRYNGFHALAIQAIKEQQSEIEALKGKIDRLESQLSSITERINQMEN